MTSKLNNNIINVYAVSSALLLATSAVVMQK